MLAPRKGIELRKRPRQRLSHDLTHDMTGSNAMPRIPLAIPDIIGKLAQLRNAVHHNPHRAAPLELDIHTLERRKSPLDTRPQLRRDIPRITPRIIGPTPKQQAAITCHAVVIQHKAAVIYRQVLRVELARQVAQWRRGHNPAHGREDLALELLALKFVVHIAS
ncbi:hypothetical protein D9M71_225030 [compost metagenome]